MHPLGKHQAVRLERLIGTLMARREHDDGRLEAALDLAPALVGELEVSRRLPERRRAR